LIGGKKKREHLAEVGGSRWNKGENPPRGGEKKTDPTPYIWSTGLGRETRGGEIGKGQKKKAPWGRVEYPTKTAGHARGPERRKKT